MMMSLISSFCQGSNLAKTGPNFNFNISRVFETEPKEDDIVGFWKFSLKMGRREMFALFCITNFALITLSSEMYNS